MTSLSPSSLTIDELLVEALASDDPVYRALARRFGPPAGPWCEMNTWADCRGQRIVDVHEWCEFVILRFDGGDYLPFAAECDCCGGETRITLNRSAPIEALVSAGIMSQEECSRIRAEQKARRLGQLRKEVAELEGQPHA